MTEANDWEGEEGWETFIRGLADGKPWAYDEFWKRYGSRLDAVAKKHFPAGLQRRLAPEDIVQSTCRSFFTRIVDGRLSVSDSDSLWGLLCAITLNKTRMKQRYHLAKRRTLSRESDPGPQDSGYAIDVEPSGQQSSPEEAAIFAEELERVMEVLDPIEREVLQWKLENFTHEEIAAKVRRSDRTIRRVVQRIQEKLQANLITQSSQKSP